MKKLLFILVLISPISAQTEKLNLESATKELLLRGGAVEPESIVLVCNKYKEWCNGYYTALIHNFSSNNVKICIPKNNAGRQIDDGVWAIVKSWLYRQDKSKKITLQNAIKDSLIEHNQCQ